MRNALKVSDVNSDQVQRVQALLSIVTKVVSKETLRHQPDDTIFVELFGLDSIDTCDFISLLESLPHVDPMGNYEGDGYERLIKLAKQHKADHVEPWIRKHLSVSDAAILHAILAQCPDKLSELVSKIPDKTTTEVAKKSGFAAVLPALLVGGFTPAGIAIALVTGYLSQRAVNNQIDNSAEDSKALKLARRYIKQVVDKVLKRFDSVSCPRLVASVSALLDNIIGNSHSSENQMQRMRALLEMIQPFIFGGTPMVSALKHATSIFTKTLSYHKILVIISDGEASDGDPVALVQQIPGDVVVVTCYLTSKLITNSKQLFYKEQDDWEKGERVMFRMSSKMPNTHHPLSLLRHAHWRLASEGESRLFLRANNLDIVNEFFNTFVSHLTDISGDAFLDLIGIVDLDLYINKLNEEASSPLQKGGTCYANAAGFVFHLAMQRIVGREVPSFFDIRASLIQLYGTQGASTMSVLANEASKYRLHFIEVDEEGARQAINMRRPVIGTFGLTDGNKSQWESFTNFFATTPKGILERSDVGEAATTILVGHSAILMRCEPSSLTFMNSWGDKWANGGFFSIKDATVLSNPSQKMRFYDVYWTVNDLTQEEINAYETANVEKSKQLADKFPSVKELMVTGPLCNTPHPLDFYYGHCLSVECPSCNRIFKPTGMIQREGREERRRRGGGSEDK